MKTSPEVCIVKHCRNSPDMSYNVNGVSLPVCMDCWEAHTEKKINLVEYAIPNVAAHDAAERE